MAVRGNRVTAPELEQFIVATVELTGNVLGAGAYGSVEEVEIPGARVAAKKLHPGLVDLGSPQQVEKWVTDFVEECKLMSQLRHPHIVQFLGVCYLPDSRLPVLLMEKLQTSLDSLLETTPNIPIDVKVHLLTGTGRGVVYLHSHTPPIAHRDLTARNILVDSGLNAKIADLGVAKMVNVCPDQLAATMTNGPGNGLYMPPETMQEEGVTRYNTAIDIFSFGVVSLFTLTQTFPKNLKPATYRDPRTRRIVGRSEIERREDYIQSMKADLSETHPLVQLTLDCLEYDSEDRPSAVVVLRRLEEVGTTVPQNCTKTKLELIAGKEEAIQRVTEKQAQNDQLRQEVRLTVTVNHLQAEKQDHCGLITLQQEQLETQRKEIEQLTSRLQSLKVQPQRSGQRDVPVARPRKPPPQPVAPSSITFNWRRCKNRPQSMWVLCQPAVIRGKLYSRGWSNFTETVLVYTPDQDHWDELPLPPVEHFTITTLREQLLLVGGRDKSTNKTTKTIFTFDDHSQKWQQSLSAMPKELRFPAVVVYQDHLIVAGGQDSSNTLIGDVNILDNVTNNWITAERLPSTDRHYYTTMLGDFLYIVCPSTKTVLGAHVPSLISQASGVWESLLNAPYCCSSPITIGNTLLTVGGNERFYGDNPTSNICCYDPIKNQWTRVGDLPEAMSYCSCTQLSGKLYVLGELVSRSVFVCTPSLIINCPH